MSISRTNPLDLLSTAPGDGASASLPAPRESLTLDLDDEGESAAELLRAWRAAKARVDHAFTIVDAVLDAGGDYEAVRAAEEVGNRETDALIAVEHLLAGLAIRTLGRTPTLARPLALVVEGWVFLVAPCANPALGFACAEVIPPADVVAVGRAA